MSNTLINLIWVGFIASVLLVVFYLAFTIVVGSITVVIAGIIKFFKRLWNS